MGKRWTRLRALAGSLVVVARTVTAGTMAASASAARPAAASPSAGVKPDSASMMDCNGHSPVYKSVSQDVGGRCVDPRGTWGGRFEDNGKTVSDYAELSPAPWFGLPLCDPKSYPQNPCTPDSDSDFNSGAISNNGAAGSAFMELQFYPPGYQPIQDAISCDSTPWCAAVTIDSLESPFNFANLNQYGRADVARYGGTLASPVLANPQTRRNC